MRKETRMSRVPQQLLDEKLKYFMKLKQISPEKKSSPKKSVFSFVSFNPFYFLISLLTFVKELFLKEI